MKRILSPNTCLLFFYSFLGSFAFVRFFAIQIIAKIR